MEQNQALRRYQEAAAICSAKRFTKQVICEQTDEPEVKGQIYTMTPESHAAKL
jgi:hypothetical protein